VEGPTLAEIARSKVKAENRDRQLAVAKDSLKHVATARHSGETAENVARAAEITELQRYREERQSSVPDQRGAGWRGGVVGAAIALLAAAAAFVFYVSEQHPARPTVPSDDPIAAQNPAQGDEPRASDEGDEPAAKLDELPVEQEDAPGKTGPRLAARPSPATKPKLAKAETEPKKPGTHPGAQPAPDEFDTKLPSADDSEIHERLAPTTGEALAAVAPSSARAKICVAGHAKQSTATVTFGSDGHVESVMVAGPAAGTPAADCIRTAFMTARVAPFAKPRFAVNLAVRP
jgi:hypothetical protein